jgi:hypothetical protein
MFARNPQPRFSRVAPMSASSGAACNHISNPVGHAARDSERNLLDGRLSSEVRTLNTGRGVGNLKTMNVGKSKSREKGRPMQC